MIFDDFRILLEDIAFLRVLDVTFDNQNTFGLDQLRNGEQKAKDIQEIFFVPFWLAESFFQSAQCSL